MVICLVMAKYGGDYSGSEALWNGVEKIVVIGVLGRNRDTSL